MKRRLLKTTMAICILALTTSCTEDAANDYKNSESTNIDGDYTAFEKSSRPDYWDGVIGEDINGTYVITIDETLVKKDLEEALKRTGKTTTLQTVEIVSKTASNDGSDIAFFLIGYDNKGITISLMLDKRNNTFLLYNNNGFVKTVTCEGCISGCNLQYLKVNGQRVAYCNENGCVYDCSKTESEFN